MLKILLLAFLVVSLQAFSISTIKRHFASGRPANNYPIRVGYVDRNHYWSGDHIANGLGVPGYTDTPHDYNYIMLAFWSCNKAPKDMALLWSEAYKYFGPRNTFGNDTDSVQKALKKKYNDAGIKIMVSAFGSTEFPTTLGQDPVKCGTAFGQFIKANNLDGGDVDWQDNKAMFAGTGEEWLIKFTKAFRVVAPDHILTHAPQAPYFKNQYYKNGGYITIDKEVGSMIDFYMIQFYNQVNSKYNTFEELFVHATGDVFNGTAVKEIAARGVPLQKLVVGKPVTWRDVSNTGFVNQTDLGQWAAKAHDQLGWYAGIGHWQYPSDLTGKSSFEAASPLQQKCKQSQKCK